MLLIFKDLQHPPGPRPSLCRVARYVWSAVSLFRMSWGVIEVRILSFFCLTKRILHFPLLVDLPVQFIILHLDLHLEIDQLPLCVDTFIVQSGEVIAIAGSRG